MEPTLDERSLVLCDILTPPQRIDRLSKILKSLDELGAQRVLRSAQNASDRDIGYGRGLRSWCFDPCTSRDAGLLVAERLSRQPFIDGAGGLFAVAEGNRAVEALVGDEQVIGLGLAALADNTIVVTLPSIARTTIDEVEVKLIIVDEDGERTESKIVCIFSTTEDVQRARAELIELVKRLVVDGQEIVARLAEMYPSLRLGEQAHKQINELRGNEPVFQQLLRHLSALQEGALRWIEGTSYEPVAVTFSVESKTTLEHGTYGPLRDFAMPEGFEFKRWSLHTKLTGGNGARLYFRPEWVDGQAVILVGYFGDHLPTVKYH